MGTNYYYEKNVCARCNRSDKPLHIGKSSGGWCFSLHVTDDIKDLDQWRAVFDSGAGRIVDEYGRVLTPDEMLSEIVERSCPASGAVGFDYERNEAEPGPNGLVRHKINRHCIGHGAGTWDLIAGTFS